MASHHRKGDKIRARDAARFGEELRANSVRFGSGATNFTSTGRGVLVGGGDASSSSSSNASFFARLSGSGPNYDYTEVRGLVTDPYWQALSGGRTGQADEVNGITGLNGKIARVDRNGLRYSFDFHRICTGSVCILIRDEATGLPMSGVTATVKVIGSPTTIGTGDTDSDGKYCTSGFSRTVPHSVTLTAPNPFDSSTPLTCTFFYPLSGGTLRDCDLVHEYDFCSSQMCLTVQSCSGGGAISGLRSGAPGKQLTLNVGENYEVLPPNRCSNLINVPEASSSGIYCSTYLRLRERPYLAIATSWKWSANIELLATCDQTGVYKPSCGRTPLICGSSPQSSVTSMYPLAPDWLAFTLTQGQAGGATEAAGCDVGCFPGTDGIGTGAYATNTDCSPSGLIKNVLYFTATGNDADDSIGSLSGVPIALTCVGSSGGDWNYTSGPLSNMAGSVPCCSYNTFTNTFDFTDCITKKFTVTTVTARVRSNGSVDLSWTNSGAEECPEGYREPPLSRRGEILTGGNTGGAGHTCHPTDVTCGIRQAGAGVFIPADLSE